ncbi:carboxypeptidase-like regulatory domain-containing protein [Dyella sp. 2HG41-7]|uniref:carboxypeptidase-like regulatory domain-containing protein n=1 Tax=Dyella sp. 2HG41-7 TaxID=2883239 RepID=UPI001F28DF90|nr:carboxypeptidase-like regulatory domain-containing protein [Dyella sp. 2HG41-7]
MKINQIIDINHPQKRGFSFATKLTSTIAMVAMGVMTFTAAHAQDTDSRIGGKAPADATIVAHSDIGMTNHSVANSKGRYTLARLRPGTYVVSLERNGKTLASVSGVPLYVGVASEVDFACNGDECTASMAR